MGKTIYSKRQAKIVDLLRLFLFEKELHQSDLPNLANLSKWSVIRQIQLLEKNELIKLVRVERPKKQGYGRGKHVYAITFYGILQAIALDGNQVDFDKLAQIHKDKWLIFQEWSYLSRDEEAKRLAILGTQLYAAEVFMVPAISDQTLGGKIKAPSKFPVVVEIHKDKATLYALWLNLPFNRRCLTGDFYTEEFRKIKTASSNLGINHLWKYAIKNDNLRKFFENQFSLENKIHALILEFENWLFAKKERD